MDNTWTVRTLDRNISTQYYERLLLSQIEAPVKNEMTAKTAGYQADKFEFIKNPSVLEFLNLPARVGKSNYQSFATIFVRTRKRLCFYGATTTNENRKQGLFY